MASRSEQRAQEQATEQRRNDACRSITEALTNGGANAQEDAAGVLSALADAIVAEATETGEQRRKGWQSAMKAHVTAAEIVKTWRDNVLAHTPPKALEGPPIEASPTTDAQGIPVSARAGSTADLDARLATAFGSQLAPVRHIRTVVEPKALEPGASVADGPAFGPLCGSDTGSFTHPGGANCETCHAMYAESNGGEPYRGPGHVNAAEILRRDEPVTPAVAREIREEVEAENDARRLLGLPTRQESADAILAVVNERAEREAALGIDAGGAALRDFIMPPVVEPPARPPTPPVRQRMTLAQVREHGLARARGAQHRSVSQVQGYTDCGTRYAIDDLERPAWWNVGGKAFHACAEEIDRTAAAEQLNGFSGDGQGGGERAATLWSFHLAYQVTGQKLAAPGFPEETWRAANKGSEHYDWWRVEGPPMVDKYLVWLGGMFADGWLIARDPAGVPAIEYPVNLDVGIAVPELSILDLVLWHPHFRTLLVVDFKAGGSAPKDTFQLGVYGWCALSAGLAAANPRAVSIDVRGAYYRARKGEMLAPLPVLDMHPWPDVVQRFRDQDVMERQGVYMPNVTTFCGGCGVRDLCPAQSS